jgi:phosphate acetyltransferase
VNFPAEVRARAARARRRIVFPESADERTLVAVRTLAARRIVEPVLILDPAAPETHAAVRAVGVEVLDPATDPRRERVVDDLLRARAHKGLAPDAAAALATTPLYLADSLVHHGDAHGCVAGVAHTTAAVLRAALWLIGPAAGVRTVSSAFYMVVPPFRDEAAEVLTFTDCAVVPTPTAEQLADIAVAAAGDRRLIVGDQPCVALLSFSTYGSGSGPSVDLVTAAVARIRAMGIDFPVDGELQGDAALIRSVAERKAPGSEVAGRANVLVFPTLDAGNIAYKLVQRLANAQAIGPIIQGLRRPCSDLSRGAVSDDIINVAAITALQGREASSH